MTTYLPVTDAHGQTVLMDEQSLVVKQDDAYAAGEFAAFADDFGAVEEHENTPWSTEGDDRRYGQYGWMFDPDEVDWDIGEYLIDYDADESHYVVITDSVGAAVAFEESSLVVREISDGIGHDYVAYADDYIASNDSSWKTPVDVREREDEPGRYKWYFDADGVDFDVDEYLVNGGDDSDEGDDTDDDDDDSTEPWLGREQTVERSSERSSRNDATTSSREVHHAVVEDGDTIPAYVSILETRHVATPSDDDRLHIWFTDSSDKSDRDIDE